MKFYAILNENKICTGISQLSCEVKKENMIEIQTFSEEYMWKKYESGVWSNEKFEPETTTPLTEFELVKKRVSALENAYLEDRGAF